MPGLVALPNVSSWVPELLDELAAFPTGAHDDQVDAFVHALGYAMRAMTYDRPLGAHDVTVSGGPAPQQDTVFQRMRLPEPARARR